VTTPEDAKVVYGRLQEDAHIVAEFRDRGQENLAFLLEENRWKKLGFKDIDEFAESLRLTELRARIEERRQAVKALTAAGAKQESIGKAVGIKKTAVSEDQHAMGVSAERSNRNGHATQESVVNSARRSIPTITLRSHDGQQVEYPEPRSAPTFNKTQGDGISWAGWSWNPVTGCLHGCEYCYAREIATNERTAAAFPLGFTPLFHHERLAAPRFTVIPEECANDPRYERVFVCSMADLYGRWVPDEWINQVHAAMLASPQWQYILLTKFPARYVGLDLPPNAWVGTSVDEQKRVRLAEDAFRQISDVKVKWLSLEPLREPLEFSDFSMFDWVVIGAQTETRQPNGVVEAFAPPFDWVARLYVQAKDAGCKVHIKPNCWRSAPGLDWPNEYPESEDE